MLAPLDLAAQARAVEALLRPLATGSTPEAPARVPAWDLPDRVVPAPGAPWPSPRLGEVGGVREPLVVPFLAADRMLQVLLRLAVVRFLEGAVLWPAHDDHPPVPATSDAAFAFALLRLDADAGAPAGDGPEAGRRSLRGVIDLALHAPAPGDLVAFHLLAPVDGPAGPDRAVRDWLRARSPLTRALRPPGDVPPADGPDPFPGLAAMLLAPPSPVQALAVRGLSGAALVSDDGLSRLAEVLVSLAEAAATGTERETAADAARAALVQPIAEVDAALLPRLSELAREAALRRAGRRETGAGA